MASPRSAWTFAGSYGLLHFTNPGYLDSTDYEFSAGYNYVLTSKDTIGVSYQFDATRFSPSLASINNHTISVHYGHHISKATLVRARRRASTERLRSSDRPQPRRACSMECRRWIELPSRPHFHEPLFRARRNRRRGHPCRRQYGRRFGGRVASARTILVDIRIIRRKSE